MSVYNRRFITSDHQPDPAHLQTVGPRIPVEISIPSALVTQLTAQNLPIPQPINGYALVDTGASMLAVDERILQRLQLRPFSTGAVSTGAGTVVQGIYPVSMSFPGTTVGAILVARCLGANLGDQVNPPLNTIALIGRDTLRDCILVYNGPLGIFTLAH